MSGDPVETNPTLYRVLFENERVRVLEYTDQPGTLSVPHHHPDSVMVTLSDFRRELISGTGSREVELHSGQAVWVPEQSHSGHNIGTTATHTIFVELKGQPHEQDLPHESGSDRPLGPQL